jgi:sugar (pentulose or hexulose) kinase
MYFLGIDTGAGGTRALVIDEAGRVIASALSTAPAQNRYSKEGASKLLTLTFDKR